MELSDGAHKCQAQTKPGCVSCGFAAKESFGRPLYIGLRNAVALVRHAEAEEASFPFCGEPDRAPWGRKLQRIVQQVGDGLLDQFTIPTGL
jgi:hypothetical protein